eukprot:CAMPEP_0118676432 /NCGR_PEP_ID=MMETSP0800-20121206/2044_1 /TAXON_ID=210618 ORGANISM="Striatella unipunctata, Strain CCMP2910" /NCGR_SAMPLE_ID=MMETSP0800 /ASSEMBLY_ACC=CAM_ASM_000638 /LENGTH=556 /DNA_ID=CAMNT_0006571945 /DNA_START=77 /DNA_END=1747 /DNA_ORIENTATION=-
MPSTNHDLPLDDSASDPFLLSWGSSVHVNEDLRRGISKEVEEIDGSISALLGSIKNEESTAEQVNKDLLHARTEMINLRRSAGDEVDRVAMDEQVRLRLAETLYTQVTAAIEPRTPFNTPQCKTALNTDSVETSDEQETNLIDTSNKDPSNNRESMPVNIHFASLKGKLRQLSLEAKEQLLKLQGVESKKSAVQQEIDDMEKRIQSEDLEVILKKLDEEIEMRQRDLEQEQQRKRTTVEAIQSTRKRSGENAQQIADQTKQIALEREQHAIAENQLTGELSQLQKDADAMETGELKDLELRFSSITSNSEFLAKQIQLIEDAICASKEKEKELARLGQEIIALESKLQGARQEVKEREERWKLAKAEVESANEALRSVREDEKKNDDIEKEVIEPGREEMDQILKRKDALAAELTELHAKSVEDSEKSAQEILKYQEETNKINEKKNKLLDQETKISDQLKALKNEREVYLQEKGKEHEDVYNRCEKVKAELTAEQEANEDLQTRNKEHEKEVLQAKEKLKFAKRKEEFLHEFFTRAKALLEETAEKEKQIIEGCG